MENKQIISSNPQINHPYFNNQMFYVNNQGLNNMNLKNQYPMSIPFHSNINNPMIFQQSSHIPPQFLNNYKAYYNPIIYQSYLSGVNQTNQGGKSAYPLQQINNQNISAFFSSPYTINYNAATKPVQMFNPSSNGNNNYQKSSYQRKDYYTNNRIREDRTASPPIKKSASDILNIDTKVLQDPAEITKWVLSRKRNYPTDKNVSEKLDKGKTRENAGMLSTLELTLRDRLKIMNKIDKKKFVRRWTFKRKRSRKNGKRTKTNEQDNSTEKPLESEIKDIGRNENQETITTTDFNNYNQINKNNMFKYKKNRIYDNMIKKEKYKEMNVILQCFRYFVNENLV